MQLKLNVTMSPMDVKYSSIFTLFVIILNLFFRAFHLLHLSQIQLNVIKEFNLKLVKLDEKESMLILIKKRLAIV